MVRNEERDIAEWLAYHLAVGFDACLVFDNLSTDRTAEIVRKFRRRFDVRLTDWPATGPGTQRRAYRECLTSFGQEFEWISFTDADELLMPRQGDVKTLLASHGDSAAVAVNWAMFGSSGHTTRPPGLMMETFRRRAKSNFRQCAVVKYVVRPALVRRVLNPCMFALDGPVRTPGGRPVKWQTPDSATVLAEHSVAQINHYFTRSREEWRRKIERGYQGSDGRSDDLQDKFKVFDRNELEDRGILRFVPAVKQIMAEMGFDPKTVASTQMLVEVDA
jgi:Glycosyl transferase family 2